MMTSKQRVRRALDFQQPDRVPLFDSFWGEFVAAWREAKTLPSDMTPEDYYGVDIHIAAGDETLMPTRACVLSEEDGYRIERNGWGEVKRTRPDGFFYEQLEVAVREKADLERLTLDPPDLPARYASLDAQMPALAERFAVFAKVGGPFIRTEFVRGEVNFLLDIASDPQFAAEMAMFVADHLIAIGLEELRRWNLHDTGIWIFDDMASVKGPMFSPASAERILAPCWAKMVTAFKGAGAHKVVLHSDGNIRPLVDLFIDCGFDGINPVEHRAGLDALALRKQYGDKLAVLGGLDNAGVLPRGDAAEVRGHVLNVLAAGREGGLVLGMHSVGPDIAVETYDQVIELWREYGQYPMSWV